MTAIPGYKANVYVSGGASTPLSPIAMTDSGDHKTFTVTAAANRYLDPAHPVTVQTKNDEVQTITISGGPTGGTFTLTFGANTTAALAWNATAAQVQAALQALASIGANNALVSGGPGPGTPYTVEFSGTLGYAPQALITAVGSLTGGVAPAVAVTRAQAGAAFANNTTATIRYCGGVVALAAVLLGTPVAQILNGYYFAYSLAAQAKSVEIMTPFDVFDVSVFSGGAWKQKIVLLGDAQWKLSRWWLDNFYQTLLRQMVVVVAYTGANPNQRLEGYAFLKTDGIKIDVKSAIDESLDFEGSGGVFAVLN